MPEIQYVDINIIQLRPKTKDKNTWLMDVNIKIYTKSFLTMKYNETLKHFFVIFFQVY
jgi:hypothetical protein